MAFVKSKPPEKPKRIAQTWLPFWFARGGLKNIHGFDLKVLINLASHRRRNGIAYVKQQTMADELGCSKQAICKALANLEAEQYITSEGKPKHYTFQPWFLAGLPKPKKSTPSQPIVQPRVIHWVD